MEGSQKVKHTPPEHRLISARRLFSAQGHDPILQFKYYFHSAWQSPGVQREEQGDSHSTGIVVCMGTVTYPVAYEWFGTSQGSLHWMTRFEIKTQRSPNAFLESLLDTR